MSETSFAGRFCGRLLDQQSLSEQNASHRVKSRKEGRYDGATLWVRFYGYLFLTSLALFVAILAALAMMRQHPRELYLILYVFSFFLPARAILRTFRVWS